MSIVEQNVSVLMRRDDWNDLPQHGLPPGVIARWHRPGDERVWIDVETAAEQSDRFTHKKFTDEFGDALASLPQRQCFLVDANDKALATATAWHNGVIEGAPAGRLHWVAVVPEAQGKGLAKPLLSIVCNRMRDLGHDKAMLATSTKRLPAINLYLYFGFRPLIETDAHAAAWRELAAHLKYPIDVK